MAAGVDTTELSLTAKDIPGAELGEPFEQHQVPKLKWWLLCRGIKTPSSWKKAQIVTRLVFLNLHCVHNVNKITFTKESNKQL